MAGFPPLCVQKERTVHQRSQLPCYLLAFPVWSLPKTGREPRARWVEGTVQVSTHPQIPSALHSMGPWETQNKRDGGGRGKLTRKTPVSGVQWSAAAGLPPSGRCVCVSPVQCATWGEGSISKTLPWISLVCISPNAALRKSKLNQGEI